MLSGCGAVDKTMKRIPTHQAYKDLLRTAKGLPDAKFFTLREIGVEEDLLNLVYCRIAPGDRPHVVVGYLADADSPLILDSVVDDIVPARERSDLSLILGFNSKGLWVFKNGVRHKISTNPKRLRPWEELMQRMPACASHADREAQ